LAPRLTTSVLALAALAAPAAAQSRLGKNVAALVESAIADRVFPGCQIVVRQRGKTLLARAYGRETYASDAAAITLDTRYDLASLTKVVATTGVAMALYAQRKLDLDADVTALVPEFVAGKTAKVTSRNLLTHTSGLPAWKPIYKQAKSPEQARALVLATALETEPGSRYKYSDLGMILFGIWLERKTGKSLDTLARELVFEPLAMSHTRFGPLPDTIPAAPTEVVPERGGLVHRKVHDENANALGGVAGHAGLFSTATDVATYAEAVRTGEKPFDAATTSLFTHRANVVPGSSRALGFDTQARRSSAGRMLSARAFGHTGFTGTSLWVDPARSLVVVCLTNRVHPTRKGRGIARFRRRLHDRIAQTLASEGHRPYRAAALATAKFLAACAHKGAGGIVWPVDPDRPSWTATNLYRGSAGVVLFFLRAYRSTGEAKFLELARRGGDALVASLDRELTEDTAGLYTGVAGIGFVLAELHAATGDGKYKAAAERCVTLLDAAARRTEDGVDWNTSNDIIRGTAGIGLFLLDVHRRYANQRALELAVAGGHRLLALARKTEHGLAWARRSDSSAYQPNFSHGTAGVSYFLIELAERSKKTEFLEAALAGAAEVVACSDPKTCFVPHHLPGGERLFYLSWCHGPAGTCGLFYRLWRQTGEHHWLDRACKAADAILATGVPDKRTPGFWNNDGICCGTAGLARFFLELYRVTERPRYQAFALRATNVLLERAVRTGDRMFWRNAEYRVRPDQLSSQTGYMQGAAGIGTWLLDLDGWLTGDDRPIRLPDSPFRRD